MKSIHAECIVEIYFLSLMFLKFKKHIYFLKINIGLMGIKITTLSQEPVNC